MAGELGLARDRLCFTAHFGVGGALARDHLVDAGKFVLDDLRIGKGGQCVLGLAARRV